MPIVQRFQPMKYPSCSKYSTEHHGQAAHSPQKTIARPYLDANDWIVSAIVRKHSVQGELSVIDRLRIESRLSYYTVPR